MIAIAHAISANTLANEGPISAVSTWSGGSDRDARSVPSVDEVPAKTSTKSAAEAIAATWLGSEPP